MGNIQSERGWVVNRLLIVETAFNMARMLSGKFGDDRSDEELRQMFDDCFKTCRSGLEAFCLQNQRTQHKPKEKDHESATAK